MDILLNLILGIVGSLIAAYLYQHGAAIGRRVSDTVGSLDLSFTPVDTTALRWLSMFALAVLSMTSLYMLVQGIYNFTDRLFISVLIGIGVQVTLFTASWIVAPNPTRYPLAIFMLAPSMAVSIFFTFHFLYNSMAATVRAASSLRDTRSQIITSLAEIEFEMRAERARRIAMQSQGIDWRRYVGQLDSLMTDALSNQEAIEAAQAIDNERSKSELGDLRERLRAIMEQIGLLESKIRGSATSPSEAFNVASERIQRVQENMDDLRRSASELTSQMQAEESTGAPSGSRRGRGPQWLALKKKLEQIQATIESKQTQLRQLQRDLEGMQALVGELGIRKAEEATLQSKVQELESRPNLTSTRVAEGGTISNSIEIRVAELQHSRGEFSYEWSSRALVSMETNCRLLLQLVKRAKQSTQKGDPSTCDATAFLGPVRDEAKFDSELVAYRQHCILTRDMTEFQSVAQVVERGRECLAVSALAPALVSKARSAMDNAERAADPATSKFEITTSALTRGDHFALMSLVMAFLIELLLPMAAVFATRAAVAPSD